MVIHKLEWDEKQFEISCRILRPCRCLVCGTPYLSEIDEYTGTGKRCPLGHEQVEHHSKCGLCDFFVFSVEEHGPDACCEHYVDNLKGWPFMKGCKKFTSHGPEYYVATWNNRQRLMDEFAKMRKNAPASIVMPNGE